MKHSLMIYLYLIYIRFKSQISYHQSFLIEIFAYFIQMGTHIAAIYFIFHYIKALAGWSLWEVLYLYGITSLCFSIANLSADAFQDLSHYIKSGEFDQMLTKPISPLIQIASQSLRIERLGGFFQSVAVLILAFYQLDIEISLTSLFLILSSIISMSLIYYSLFLASGAFTFWTVESTEIFNIFTYGGIEVAKYPLSIYPNWMQQLFIYLIPLGFACYVPSAELFLKPTNLGVWTPSALFTPLFGLLFLFLAYSYWQFSLKHYHSTGS